MERGLAAQRRQWDLQLDQARYEARLAQKRSDAVDLEHRLVAAELERRWNEKLERVARLEQAYARAEQETRWTLAQGLPPLCHAETTTKRERKQLLRMAIESVQLDGGSQPGQIDIQILWRTGTITTLRGRRARPGDGSLKTPAGAVARIAELASTRTYPELAEVLKAEGWVTAFGRAFTREHVGYLCRRHGWGRGKQHGHRPRHEPISDAAKETDSS